MRLDFGHTYLTNEGLYHTSSADKHSVAEAEEAILFPDGFIVGGEHALASDQSGDQEKERRPGGMEVRQQRVHYSEGVARHDEEVGSPFVGEQLAVGRGVLERADA